MPIERQSGMTRADIERRAKLTEDSEAEQWRREQFDQWYAVEIEYLRALQNIAADFHRYAVEAPSLALACEYQERAATMAGQARAALFQFIGAKPEHD